jgi:hypothetical protein
VSPSSTTTLASGALTATDTITVELIEADETPRSSLSAGPLSRPCCIRGGSPTLQPPSRGYWLRLTPR